MAATGLDAIAWEVYETGATYADVATYANHYDVSIEDAMLALWIEKAAA